MSFILFLPLNIYATSHVFLQLPGRMASRAEVQIKNIKLHIVTDIKVGINSMLVFRISLFGWGAGLTYLLKKLLQLYATSIFVVYKHIMLPREASSPCSPCLPCLSFIYKTWDFGSLDIRILDARRPFGTKTSEAYGTRCSQAVPHPSTIMARQCLTSVIRRERVFSLWCGRRH